MTLIDATVRDPNWFAHRYDPIRDLYHMIPADRAVRAAAVFLIDEYLSNAVSGARPLARSAALQGAAGTTPQNRYIFHSAFCCSTLLANALERPGTASTLKEPVVLNDLIGWRRRGGAPRDVDARLSDTLTILGANVPQGERLVIKPSNVVNAFAPTMMAIRPEARALLLHAPLRTFVASIASKGMWGRLWVRDLWTKLAADGLCELGFEPGADLRQTDLQIAAMGWLAQHRLFATMARQFPDRVRTLDSVALLADRHESMTAINAFFGFDLDATSIAEIAEGAAFGHHAKSGERFGPRDRDAVHAAATDAHRDEIDKVVAWTEAVARANAIPLTLPNRLL